MSEGVTITFAIERGLEELVFEVDGAVIHETPDVQFLPNGDPGVPGSPASSEIHSLRWVSGHWVYRNLIRDEGELTEEELERLHEQLWEASDN